MNRCAPLVLLGALAFSATAPSITAWAQELQVTTGTATVIDANHLDVAGKRFKLYGIDAPDTDETCQTAKGVEYPCGIEARDALMKLVAPGEVSCLPRGPNALNETMAICTIGQTDIARALTEAGWALADRARTLYYEDPELTARTAKRGIWQGKFVSPDAWRIGERVPPSGHGAAIPEVPQ
ncbi:MAG TPA: thermonuclease family protein [Alphaproteobacteria bacterium]|nr:thermonuclease family protein [Alphaproteobacteria bacterium]